MGIIKLNKQVASTGRAKPEKKSTKEFEEQVINKSTQNQEICEIAEQDDGFVEEIKELRTANETVYRRNDRTCRKIITANPTRYRDENGEYKKISNRLIDNGAEISNESNSFKVKFDKDAHNGKIFDLQKGNKKVALSAVSSANARNHSKCCKCELCVDKNDTVLATLDDGTEIEYVTLNDRIKENIIVKERQKSYEYYFKLNIGDLAVEEGEHNDLLLKDAQTGETEFVIPAPYMYDANKKHSNKVSYEIDVNGQELEIKVVADANFINAEERAFPVTIDPQIIIAGDGSNITFKTRTQWLDDDERITYDTSILEVEDRNIIRDAEVFFTRPSLSDIGNVTSVKMFLTVREGKGNIIVNNQPCYVQGADIDIPVNLPAGDNFRMEPTYNDSYAYAKFYTTGAKGPRFVIDYIEDTGNSGDDSSDDPGNSSGNESGSDTGSSGGSSEGTDMSSTYDEENVTPTIKEFDFADKVKGLLYVKDGKMVTTFSSCQSADSILPIKIRHIHKYGFGDSSYGLNWRLNISKKLKVATDDTSKTTKLIYTDELGDSYPFTEKYYYLDNGVRTFIDKNLVSIDLDGKLSYNDNEVYKYQSCKNYTLISEINDFKNFDLIEKRQDEQIQLENYINQMVPTLSSYVKVYGPTGQTVKELGSLEKENYEALVSGLSATSSYVLVTSSEACQLQSLFSSKNQLNTQKYQLEIQRSQLTLQKQQLEIQKNQYINQNKQISYQIQSLQDNKKLSEKIYSNVANLVDLDNLTINAYQQPNGDNPNEERNETISKAREYLSYKSTNSSLISLTGATFGQYELLQRQRELVQPQIDNVQGQINTVDGQLSDCAVQLTLLENQISTILSQAKLNLKYVKDTFVQYFRKKAELDLLLKQVPVNYIKDENGIISGFNSDGNLVMISDSYDNCVALTYNSNDLITEISDNKNKVMLFKYANGLLHTITDNCGQSVSFEYNGTKLEKAIKSDDNYLTFKYSSNRLASVNSDNRTQLKMSYTDSKLTTLMEKRLEPVSGTVSELNISYQENHVELSFDDGTIENYRFDNCSRVEYYRKRDGAFFEERTNIRYDYDNGKKVTCTKDKSPDYIDEVEISQYNDIDLLVSKIEDWKFISDTVKVKVETVYNYDLDNKLINETSTKFIDKSNTVTEIVSIKNYSYNAQGRLVLTESYVEGEELISGKNYKQTVYDENGHALKSISWNSLDSSSKFYEESDRAENGQIMSDRDETGEVSAEYEYEPNSGAINSVKYPNGSKLAYGRDLNKDKVTSITQSTDDGESNQTDILYRYGQAVKVTSGNTVIDYTYDEKDRKSSVTINGVLQSTYSYEDYKLTSPDDVRYEKVSETLNIGGSTVKSVYLKTGNLDSDVNRMTTEESLTVGSTTLYTKNYNVDGELVSITYKAATEENVTYTYDTYDNLIKAEITANGVIKLTENFTYNEYGELTCKAITGAVSHTYNYYYDDTTASCKLKYTSFGNYKFYPLSDVIGRNTGKEIYNGANKIAGEYITYRKVGDHATNMPATVWFGSGNNIKDSIKYKYDSCGNICQIMQNGHIVVKYTYDSLNRLVREDNEVCNSTTVYTYDQCGNIIERCEYDYTRKTGEELSELKCKHSSYDYNGDRLIIYKHYDEQGNLITDNFAYNTLGNPTIYRNKSVTWQYGRYLTQLGNTTFAYDGLGRRISKGGINFTYDNDGRLIKQSNGLEFIYDDKGVVGVKYANNLYFYRKDAQGNIIAILDSNGKVVVNYVYDAWGNHAVIALNRVNGVESFQDLLDKDAPAFDPEYSVFKELGLLNPFRYRGYYYDTETEFYYLQTRYYDPEIGRFISRDSIEYADPETINGLNLYAYCGNNPVMRIDNTGNSYQDFLSIIERIFSSFSNLCKYIVNNPDKFSVAWKQFHKFMPRVSQREYYRMNSSAMSGTKNVGNVFGKIATAVAIVALVADIGSTWYKNYKSGSSTWVTDSIVDTVYIGVKFAIGYGITALCSLIPIPFLGTALGIGLSIAANYLIDWIVGETGVLNTIKNWAADVGEKIKNDWNYFWSFAWI